jgi:HPr kinase/phosphorylase
MNLHATTVAVQGQALLICGPSGSGKSGLALEMLALGAGLVADDQTIVEKKDECLWASCPEPLSGLIEMRGIGLLNATPIGPTKVAAVLDLNVQEVDRLPPFRKTTVLNVELPLLHNPASPYLASGLMRYLIEGRRE